MLLEGRKKKTHYCCRLSINADCQEVVYLPLQPSELLITVSCLVSIGKALNASIRAWDSRQRRIYTTNTLKSRSLRFHMTPSLDLLHWTGGVCGASFLIVAQEQNRAGNVRMPPLTQVVKWGQIIDPLRHLHKTSARETKLLRTNLQLEKLSNNSQQITTSLKQQSH